MANFHNQPFDDATLLKLEIYTKYLSTWIPNWIQSGIKADTRRSIKIFDFFCGPGKDANGVYGSPLIALRECLKQSAIIAGSNIDIALEFFDASPNKISQLESYLYNFSLPPEIRATPRKGEFQASFSSSLPSMTNSANLLFIDQCGIKEVNEEVFARLLNLKMTDFLFFISSSFFKRFMETPEFSKHIDASNHIGSDTEYKDSHRAIADYYRSLIPENRKYYLGSFSLKKGSNIYGLIFGSGNLAGIWKFLKVCWKIDPERGEANFDIGQDNLPKQNENLKLFGSNDTAKKVELFTEELREMLVRGAFQSDRSVASYTLQNGFLPVQHAKPVVQALVIQGKLEIEKGVRLSEACLKDPRKIRLL